MKLPAWARRVSSSPKQDLGSDPGGRHRSCQEGIAEAWFSALRLSRFSPFVERRARTSRIAFPHLRAVVMIRREIPVFALVLVSRDRPYSQTCGGRVIVSLSYDREGASLSLENWDYRCNRALMPT